MNNEESECALSIDIHPNVDCWIRNLESQKFCSFWLQTSTDKFYPDFIVKLLDGTIVVIEYKGENIYDTPDSKEKGQIGDFYAGKSGSKCRFKMLKGKDWNKLDFVLTSGKNVKYKQKIFPCTKTSSAYRLIPNRSSKMLNRRFR